MALAYHYAGAEENGRAADHFGAAGEAALRAGAFRETTVFLEKALALASDDTPETVRAHHKRRIASAWYRLGNLPRSAEAFIPDSKSLIGVSGDWTSLRTWHLDGRPARDLFSVDSGRIKRMNLDASGRFAAVVTDMNDIFVVSLAEGIVGQCSEKDGIDRVALTPGAQHLVTINLIVH